MYESASFLYEVRTSGLNICIINIIRIIKRKGERNNDEIDSCTFNFLGDSFINNLHSLLYSGVYFQSLFGNP